MEPSLEKLFYTKRSIINRPCNPDQWKRNRQKISRVSGLAYETAKGSIVGEKRFVVVDKCCTLQCSKKVEASSQQYLFDEFWKRGKSKQIQDLNLAVCFKKMEVKRRRSQSGMHRSNQWQYYLRLGTVDVRVCRTFFSNLYQISEKRLRVIQQKIVRGDTSFHEKRGHHTNRPHKIPGNVLSLMREHLSLVSMDESFIIPAKGKDNFRLDFKKLHDSFSRFYESKTETSVPITRKQYLNLFRKRTEYLSASSTNQDYFGYESVEVVESSQETGSQVINGQDSLAVVDELFDEGHVDQYTDDILQESNVIQHEIDIDPSHNHDPFVPQTELAFASNQENHNSSSSDNQLTHPDQTEVEEVSAGKSFLTVKSCCLDKCYQKFELASQKYLYDDFWNRGKSKQIQDLYLASCFIKADVKPQNVQGVKRRRNRWNFFVKLDTINVRVCLSFLLNLYQVSQKRIRTIQRKVLRGETSFPETRGRRNTNRLKLPPKVIPLLIKHTSLIPHYESTSAPRCKHFQNQDLDLKKIYKSFREYYQENMTAPPIMKFRTYEKLFHQHSQITFSAFEANQCDICVLFKSSALPSEDQITAQMIHEEFHKTYTELKDELTNKAKRGNFLLIEFDYIPSICIPRLNVVQEIYKQLPSVHGFNVHNHCDDSSYMYLFTESKTEKNIDSIISFIFATIQPILNSNHTYEKVILLCNDCQGQSKQIPLVQFCSWMSAIHRIPFQQIFPAKGHFVNIHRDNYALFRERNKKRARIINAKPILIDMVSARPHPFPFIVSYDSPIVNRWSEALIGFFSAKPKTNDKQKFLLQSYTQLKYYDGKVYVNSTFYNDPTSWSEFNYILKIGNLILHPAISPGVLPAKRQDVFSLFHLMTTKEIIEFQESFGV